MANYSYICGFEMGHLGEVSSYVSSGASISSSIKRTGAYSLRSYLSVSNAEFQSKAAGGTQRSIFGAARFYLRVVSLPTSSYTPIIFRSGGMSLYLNSSGQLRIGSGGSWSVGTLSADGLWHKVTLAYSSASSANIIVDGSAWISGASGTFATEVTSNVGPTTTSDHDLYFDDILWCSDGNSGNDIPAGGSILNLAAADVTDGSWLAGAGGSSLYPAVDNIPPAGLATATNTSQIKNATKGGSQVCSLNTGTWTAAGITASHTLNAVMAICNHGEAVATGTKIGRISASSNPAITYYDFDYGDDVGALGDFPTNWKTAVSQTVSSPSITLGSATVIDLNKVSDTTRETHADLLGVYLDYNLATASQIKKVIGVPQASCKKIMGVPIAQVKKFVGVPNV